MVKRKQNSLFPAEVVIKCFFYTPKSKIEKSCLTYQFFGAKNDCKIVHYTYNLSRSHFQALPVISSQLFTAAKKNIKHKR